MNSCHFRTCALALAIMALAGGALARTVLLVNFENGIDPAFSLTDKKAVIEPGYPTDSYQIVEGRFGKGVFVKPNVPVLNYGLGQLLAPPAGTIEFWYKPAWDCNTTGADIGIAGNSPWYKTPASVNLFLAGERGYVTTYLGLSKNQYNVYSFSMVRNYQTIYSVFADPRPIFRKDRWVHLAVSWDQDDLRIFADGRLLAASDDWLYDAATPFMALGGRGPQGTFDELRISDEKRYISSFPVQDRPFDVAGESSNSLPLKPVPLAPGEQKGFENRDVSFACDCSHGLTATFAAGSPFGHANRDLAMEPIDGKSYIRLHPGLTNAGIAAGSVGDTLAYEIPGNLNPFLGMIEIRVCLATNALRPAVLFDATHKASFSQTLTGMRLIINREGALEWQCLGMGRILSSVVSMSLALKPDTDYRLGFSWANSTIALFLDGKELVRQMDCAIPARLGKYFFVGSDCEGRQTLDGWIGGVTVYRKEAEQNPK